MLLERRVRIWHLFIRVDDEGRIPQAGEGRVACRDGRTFYVDQTNALTTVAVAGMQTARHRTVHPVRAPQLGAGSAAQMPRRKAKQASYDPRVAEHHQLCSHTRAFFVKRDVVLWISCSSSASMQSVSPGTFYVSCFPPVSRIQKRDACVENSNSRTTNSVRSRRNAPDTRILSFADAPVLFRGSLGRCEMARCLNCDVRFEKQDLNSGWMLCGIVSTNAA